MIDKPTHRPAVDIGYYTTTIFGGKVNIEASDIQEWGITLIDAGTQWNKTYGSQNAYDVTTSSGNVLTVKNSTFTPERPGECHVSFLGNQVVLDGVTLGDNKEINLFAANKLDNRDASTTIEVTKDNGIDLWNSTVKADEINLGAGKIGVWKGSVIASGSMQVNPAENVTRTDGSAGVYQRDAGSHIREKGEEASVFKVVNTKPEPPAPEPPKPVPTPELSKDDKENMASGKQAVEEALSKNASQENRIAALTHVVADLNAKASRRQTAGVVVGIVQEIADSSVLSDGEKAALVERVLNAYAPVQEAKAEQDNTATNTIDEAVSAATNVSVAPVYPDETEAEDVVSFA